MKRIIALILAAMCVCSLTTVCYAEPVTEQAAETQAVENEIMPLDLEFGEGTHIGGEFSRTYNCLKKNGAYLNFYVVNNGAGPVYITINGSYGRTIPAGSGGHICAPVTATLFAQSMTVRCVTASGDNISIEWKVAQRHVDTT